VRRRLPFALLPLVLVLTVLEAVGRTRPDPRSGPELLYEPGATLVVTEGDQVRTARPELHEQSWSNPATRTRVAFVGDSTVWGQLPDAFAAGTGVEVLNFGIRGAASDRARVAAETAVRQDLDLLVVYVGHNEVTEARLNPQSLRPFWQRAITASLLRSGTARLLSPWLAATRAPSAALRAQGDAAPQPLTPEEWAPIAESYRANLLGICALGAPTVFVEPISSLVNPGEPPVGATATVRDALHSGYLALREGSPAAALRWADELGGFYPAFGPPHALRGLAWVASGRRDEGLAELRMARRMDGQPSRATEDHFAVVREVGGACGATVVATEPTFLADPRYLSPADPLFMDRVHPTLAGNVLLASVIANASPLKLTFDPSRVTLTPPADEASRGWKLVDELWR
jgi:CTP:molybdopterin cytidylyltransferase MocA